MQTSQKENIHRVLCGIQVTYLWGVWVIVHPEDIFGAFVVRGEADDNPFLISK